MNLPDLASERDRLAVVDRPELGRYELLLDGEVVGMANYSLRDGVVTVPHVETTFRHRGKDFAARLMAGLLHDLRMRSLRIRPLCPYADTYMRERPETRELRA